MRSGVTAREERKSETTSDGSVSKSVTNEQVMGKLYVLVRKGGSRSRQRRSQRHRVGITGHSHSLAMILF